MRKDGIACPFTRGKCTECFLYRGRHYNLCFSENFKRAKRSGTRKDLRVGQKKEDHERTLPSHLYLNTLNSMSNIEDVILKEELGK
jgi:hypothetical protein